MKKLLTTLLTLMILLSSAFSGQALAKETGKPDKKEVESFKKMQKALKNTQLKLDLNKGETNSEQVIYDENGDEIGTLGLEQIAVTETTDPTSPGEIQALSTSLSKGTTYTFKVYWYAATVNYWFYIDVYRNSSTGLGEVKRVYDGDYFTFGCIVRTDVLEIIRKYETSSSPAEGRYTLTISAPIGTKLWIYGRVKGGVFYTGGN
jgi:hypothetical protein